MNNKFQRNITWELISNDTFSGDAAGTKTGTDIGKGFSLLWFYTLLESVKEITSNMDGIMCTVPGKGFIFHRLVFELNGIKVKASINIDSNINELYTLKKVILKDYKGYDLAEKSSKVLTALGVTHAVFILNSREDAFYDGLKIIARDPGLKIENLESNLELLLKNNGLDTLNLAGKVSSQTAITEHPGEPGKTGR